MHRPETSTHSLATARTLSPREMLARRAAEIDRALDKALPSETAEPRRLHQAMRYAALSPGKRLRPALVLATAEALGGDTSRAMPCAVAVELVHAFSLIQDDLPCMDDDDLRRGRPATHIAFGEATALLAADGLYTLAFEVIATAPGLAGQVPVMIATLTRGVGTAGVLGGQALDMQGEHSPPNLDLVREIHQRKTAALVRACCRLGALAASASESDREALDAYALNLGLAFQIADDLLDETASAEEAGKRTHKDRARHKQTYPAAIGVDASRAACRQAIADAIAAIRDLDRHGELRGLAEMICGHTDA